VIAVVHLVWGPLGVVPLREFLSSYRRHDAGIEHELVVLLNGVSVEQRPALEAELGGTEHRLLELGEPVQDLVAYAQAAALLEHERVCFLNSYGAILASDWLAKLADALDQQSVGLVGATGSWASLRSGVLNSLFLPNPYRGVVPERRLAREQFIAIEREQQDSSARLGLRATGEKRAAAEREGPPSRRSLIGSVLATLKTLPPMPGQLLRFESFPAAHVRTNAFMVDRATFAALHTGAIRRKMDAWALESGRNSFTRQVERRGLRALVVDRDGCCYERDDWPRSNTFWQGDQQALMVADNQTRTYTNGSFDRRRLLSAFAWGPSADPTPPSSARVIRG
jgi:hypothetical protein